MHHDGVHALSLTHTHARPAGALSQTDSVTASSKEVGSLGIYLILSLSVAVSLGSCSVSHPFWHPFWSLAPRTRVGLQRNASQMDIQCTAGFEIVGLAALGAAASEFISWLLIYRKQEYQRLSASIEKAVCRHTRVL